MGHQSLVLHGVHNGRAGGVPPANIHPTEEVAFLERSQLIVIVWKQLRVVFADRKVGFIKRVSFQHSKSVIVHLKNILFLRSNHYNSEIYIFHVNCVRKSENSYKGLHQKSIEQHPLTISNPKLAYISLIVKF